jgi:hypothetical protein
MTDVGYLSRAFTRRHGAHLRSENKHNYRYYVLDAPIISDAEYDELGFFDLCRARNLESQGVIIPASNVRHLMLRQEVVDAVGAGTFKIYAVETID